MKLTKVTCENCGAPLKVRENARFVSCAHCDAQLRIDRDEGAISTVVLESKVAKIAEDVEKLRSEAKVARLDREWEEQREDLLTVTRDGQRIVPLENTGQNGIYVAVIAGIVFVVVGGFILSLPDMPGPASIVFFAGAGVVVWWGISNGNAIIRKARAYRAAEDEYLERRERLLRPRRGSSATE